VASVFILLADYLREHLSHLRAWSIDEPSLRQLKLLREVRYRYTGRVEDRDKVVQQKVRLQNQLRQTLIEYFPQAVEAFSDLTTQTANESITLSFENFSLTQGKSETEFNQFLDECRCFHPKARQRFLDAKTKTS